MRLTTEYHDITQNYTEFKRKLIRLRHVFNRDPIIPEIQRLMDSILQWMRSLSHQRITSGDLEKMSLSFLHRKVMKKKDFEIMIDTFSLNSNFPHHLSEFSQILFIYFELSLLESSLAQNDSEEIDIVIDHILSE